jgi:hypothetical protein
MYSCSLYTGIIRSSDLKIEIDPEEDRFTGIHFET